MCNIYRTTACACHYASKYFENVCLFHHLPALLVIFLAASEKKRKRPMLTNNKYHEVTLDEIRLLLLTSVLVILFPATVERFE